MMIEAIARARQAAVAQVQRMQGRVNPELIVGPGRLYDAAQLLRDQGVRCVMVVTSSGFVRRGTIGSFSRDLLNHGITAAVFSEVTHDPDIECVEKAAAFYRSRSCEAIVALGGGSVMDCAKAAGALVARPNKSVRDLVGALRVRKPLPYFIAIPTTAGTGSEITVSAVITDREAQKKCVINDMVLIPDVAILDANLLVGLSPELTAATGMDALTHAVEAYINRFGSHKAHESAEEAVSLIFGNLKACYDDGQNVVHRENMLMASYDAGVAFSNATVGYVHALAHAVGARYGVQHGLATAVLLPAVLEEYGSAAEARLARLAEVIGLGGASDSDLAVRFIAKIRELQASMDMPVAFPELREEDIPSLAAAAEAEGNPAYPVPEIWDCSRFEKVLRKVCSTAEAGEAAVCGEAAATSGAAETLPVKDALPAAAMTGTRTPSPKRRVRFAAGASVGVAAMVAAAVAMRNRKR